MLRLNDSQEKNLKMAYKLNYEDAMHNKTVFSYFMRMFEY